MCPKCLDPNAEIPDNEDSRLTPQQKTQKDQEEEKAMNAFVDSLKERSKRKVKREYEKGIITWDN